MVPKIKNSKVIWMKFYVRGIAWSLILNFKLDISKSKWPTEYGSQKLK